MTLVLRKEDSSLTRDVLWEMEYTCQRWPVGKQLVHKETGRYVKVTAFEMQGAWLGRTGVHPETGARMDRYATFAIYKVYVPAMGRGAYLTEHELARPWDDG